MKQKQKIKLRNFLIGAFVAIVSVLVIGPFVFPIETPAEKIEYGVTYSVTYAESLGIDPIDGFEAMIDELGVKNVRIPVYWDRLERKQDRFEWHEIDEMIRIAEENEVDVVLAIGLRVPRWPECFFPEWTGSLEYSDLVDEQFEMVTAVVNRYKGSSALIRWQVENEPFLQWFGECPSFDKGFLEDEFELVRSLDPDTRIMTTASGELSTWRSESRLVQDMVGVSVYRRTYNPYFGYLTYPIPAWTYRAKAAMLGDVDFVVSELQGEPWFGREIDSYTDDELAELFTADDLRRNVMYANNIGFPEVYVWGVEWWYKMHLDGNSDLWNAGKMIF